VIGLVNDLGGDMDGACFASGTVSMILKFGGLHKLAI
jgi:hypothetical protein